MNKLVPSQPVLILLYGFPGSGKTFYARQICEQFRAAHVQSDRIRYELFDEPRYDQQENEIVNHLSEYLTEELLNSGVSVVYDTSVLRSGQRRLLRDMARKHGATSLLVWLQIDVESAFTRVAGRDRRRTDDKFAAAWDRTTFDDIVSRMQNPDHLEEYMVVSGKHSFQTQLASTIKKMRDMNLLSRDNLQANMAKPELVNLIPHPTAGRVDLGRRNISIR